MALMLCLVSVCGFGQSEYTTRTHSDECKWDYISNILSLTEKDNNDLSNCHSYKEYIRIYNLSCNEYIRKRIYMPSESVLHNYIIGERCFKSGKVLVTWGLVTTFVGAMCVVGGSARPISYKYNKMRHNNDAITAGCTLMGIGGSFISVSIPLLCFGDHIKRECNMIVGK